MKVNIRKLLAPMLLVIALLPAGPAPAHDFPNAGSAASARFASECAGESTKSEEVQQQPVRQPACPFAFSNSSFTLRTASGKSLNQSFQWQNFASRFARGIEILRTLSAPAPVENDALAAESRELWVATPLKGDAPAPRDSLHAAQTHMVGLGPSRPVGSGQLKFTEDYMPYDLSIRDWRFGQFPFKKHPTVRSSRAVRAEIEADSEFAHDSIRDVSQSQAGDSEQWDRLVQRVAALSKELRSHATAESIGYWAEQTTIVRQLTLQAGLRRAGQCMAAISDRRAIEPLFTNPQFVIYRDAAGTSIVLTSEQAHQWQLESQPTSAAEQIVAEQVSDSVCPLVQLGTNQLLDAVSVRLENAGSALIAASRMISALSGSRIAENSGNDLR